MAKTKMRKEKRKVQKTDEKLREWFADELKKKDIEIENLRKDNAALLATALREGSKANDILDRAKKAIKNFGR